MNDEKEQHSIKRDMNIGKEFTGITGNINQYNRLYRGNFNNSIGKIGRTGGEINI
jgi:hypothetical protein